MNYISYFSNISPGSILQLKFDNENIYYTHYGIRIYEKNEGQLYGNIFESLDDAKLCSNEMIDLCKNNRFYEKCECEIEIEENKLLYQSEPIEKIDLLYKSENNVEPIIFVSLKQCELNKFLQYSNTLYADYMNQGLFEISASEYAKNYVDIIDIKSEEELYFRDDEDIFCKLNDYNKMKL